MFAHSIEAITEAKDSLERRALELSEKVAEDLSKIDTLTERYKKVK